MSEPLVLRVVRGAPSDEELAALIAVVSSRAADATEVARPRSAWSSPAHRLREAVRPGAGGWRRSTLPR